LTLSIGERQTRFAKVKLMKDLEGEKEIKKRGMKTRKEASKKERTHEPCK
jgi:hypothetical protein